MHAHIHAHIHALPDPTSCFAHQLPPAASTLSWLDLAAAVSASIVIIDFFALARRIASASAWGQGHVQSWIQFPCATALVLPETLIGAHLMVDRFASGSCSNKLVTGEGTPV